MRSLRKKIAIIIVAILVVGVGTAYYLLTTDRSAVSNTDTSEAVTITDPDGNSYLAVEDADGVTYAAVTDASGNIYAAEVQPDGYLGDLVGDITDQVDIDTIPTTATVTTTVASSESSDSSNGSNTDDATTTTSSSSSSDATTTTSSSSSSDSVTTTTASSSSSDSAYEYKIYMYQDILSSGEFILEFYTNDDDFNSTPAKLATKNGDILMETTIDLDSKSYNCQMLYVASSNKTYLIMPDWSKYFDLPSDLLEDMDMTSLIDSFAETIVIDDITVTTIVEDGVTYTQESYINDEGLEVKYIFDGDEWVRRETVEADGSVSITYIVQASGTVADSEVSIPSGYGYLNLSWLDFLF